MCVSKQIIITMKMHYGYDFFLKYIYNLSIKSLGNFEKKITKGAILFEKRKFFS